ncbi:MAG TPA: NTP transferase domain-containing protein [Candidatus Paceibacterota bacterium]|nr:NTP transferase domain-containing protein [Candidatus Paceibacterota bacterium]
MKKINNKVKIIVLAAGKGTRMKSHLPKVLMPLVGNHLIGHLTDTISTLGYATPVAVVGHKAHLVKKELGQTYKYAIQNKQLGTAHAVMTAKEKCKGADYIVVLLGDQPFVKASTIAKTLEVHKQAKAKITLTTTVAKDFKSWRSYFKTHGRILRTKGEITGIREFKDASNLEKKIKEVNVGSPYIFDAKWLWKNLNKIGNNNSKKEYYLTDLIEIAKSQGERIENVKMQNQEALGANSKEELAALRKFAV